MLSRAYSPWQFRIYLMAIAIFFLFKFLFVLFSPFLGDMGEGSPSIGIGERFAAASALFLCFHLFLAYAIFWSLLFLEFAYLYIFLSPFSSLPSFGIVELVFVSLLLFFPAIASVKLIKKRNMQAPLTLKSDWQMPAWLFYSAQFLFLSSLGLWFFYEEIGELGEKRSSFLFMQSLFFLFVFNPRWLKPEKEKAKQKPILFFDGLCVFCNHWVDFLLREDYLHIFRYAPLQGKLSSRLFARGEVKQDSYVILYLNKDEIYFGADAMMWVCSALGGPWRLFFYFGLSLPSLWRRRIYAFVAERRYRYFGKHEQCRIPSSKEKEYFLE